MNNAQERGVQVETSYFSEPQEHLDPRLFRNGHLIPAVREGILSALYGHLNHYFATPESWTTVWLAGSGVSYQWAAHRNPADLDCLIGVDYLTFRRSNERYAHLSNREIASLLNEGFREELQPETQEFLNEFELTFYVNVISDIRNIKPYAAYSVTADDWTVAPSADVSPFPEDYFKKASKDVRMAQDIIDRYQDSLNALSMARNDAMRRNAESSMDLAAKQGRALFEDIHGGRGAAFSPEGAGYADFANFRWQYAKSQGLVEALKNMKASTPELDMPSASTLIRRAATYYR